MSTLTLIRHGQASFGAEDYDVLSPLGIRQAERLGEYFARRGLTFDAVYTGPAHRQKDTASHLLRTAAGAGADYPEAAVVEDLDEYPAFELVRHLTPILREREPEFDQLIASGGRSAHHMFTRIFAEWARGEIGTGGLETFDEFESRVHQGLNSIMAREGRGRSVAVVTSGGPIGIAVRRALGVPANRWAEMLFVLANASLTEFRFRESDFSLVGFNRIPHFDHDDLITYR